ncbi:MULTISPECIES: helix-turn-helix domain-containing protein [Pseudomonas]|uniref:Helix-turn-helix domain-containing protein n=1 Tax=Pseudomonas lactis TaxID=1615674 RepID=A0ABS9FKW1_9PSED|nr:MULTISPECIES: helix-turn-helix transcriptional regulator [Pseudomonas]MBI6975107.1 helix-turn-helix transcriptional regulator [Pseudomonas lactis]MCF4974163.1 helix-turn-helix domain-containing protein [Pseudomonas lactis]MCF5019438.1 helix-turn-helix domain-containing protein [Pseudomonas lactis]MCF5037787.1 helix-turn-helix domain-containing protein [Pseudomonas lactis]MCF5116072.1 helix-turn-helix domain-containing protein [Pseudomonas lactis]
MTQTIQSLGVFSLPTDHSKSFTGEPGKSASGAPPVILQFKLPVHTSAAAELHTEFDQFMAELETDPVHAAGFAESRSWVADTFYAEDGATIRTLRLRAGLTQKQLAVAIGTSQPQIAKIESGRHDPALSTCKRLSGALGVSLDVVSDAMDRQARLNFEKESK